MNTCAEMHGLGSIEGNAAEGDETYWSRGRTTWEAQKITQWMLFVQLFATKARRVGLTTPSSTKTQAS
jgi:hypothetical protein